MTSPAGLGGAEGLLRRHGSGARHNPGSLVAQRIANIRGNSDWGGRRQHRSRDRSAPQPNSRTGHPDPENLDLIEELDRQIRHMNATLTSHAVQIAEILKTVGTMGDIVHDNHKRIMDKFDDGDRQLRQRFDTTRE